MILLEFNCHTCVCRYLLEQKTTNDEIPAYAGMTCFDLKKI